MSDLVDVAGYPVALDRAYHPATHLWLAVEPGGVVRIGMDALGVDTSGTLAQLAFIPVGEQMRQGDAFGSLEAAKFVGPLTSPLSGVVAAHNEAVLVDPSLVERDPYGEGWLIEVEPADREEFAGMVQGSGSVVVWFAGEVEDYRLKGVLAE